MRIGQLLGLFPRALTVERHYLALEEGFLQFSQALDVRASELDAVIWYEMASSPATARMVIDQLERPSNIARSKRHRDETSSRQLNLA